MNRERAETYLRLVAEAELRRAGTLARDGAAVPPEVAGGGRGAVVARGSAVAAALYDLPLRQREVIALQYYGKLSEAGTADALHITRGAVHAHTAHAMSALRDALQAGTPSRVAQVAQVLTAVRAIDREVADQILDGLVLALGARRAGAPGQPGPDPRPLLRSPAAHLPLGMLIGSRPPAAPGRAAAGSPGTAAGGPGSARAAATPGRVIPLGQVIPVRGGEVSGEMHLLSYAHTAPGARLTVITRARGEFVPPGIEHNGTPGPFAVFPAHRFTATDENGTRTRCASGAAAAGVLTNWPARSPWIPPHRREPVGWTSPPSPASRPRGSP